MGNGDVFARIGLVLCGVALLSFVGFVCIGLVGTLVPSPILEVVALCFGGLALICTAVAVICVAVALIIG